MPSGANQPFPTRCLAASSTVQLSCRYVTYGPGTAEYDDEGTPAAVRYCDGVTQDPGGGIL